MAETAQVTNGVNVDRLVGTINAIRENPDLARFRFRSESHWDEGARSTTTIESFYGAGSETDHARIHTLQGDEPDVLLGSDTAPNAVEMMLGALAACLTVGFAYNAAARNIRVDELSFQLEGNLDLHGFLGLREDVRPGYESIRVRCQVKSPADRKQLVELSEYVQRTSPALDIIMNRVPVSIELVD